jgi:hypothetical protein
MDIQITQKELGKMFFLQRNITQMTEELDHLKSNVKAMLISGIEVELGPFDASLVYRYMRNPPWKQVVIDNLGAEFAEEIRKKTQGHTLCDVKVEEHAVLPLWNQRNTDEEDEQEEGGE